jgi:hypothetical protein
MREIFLLEKIPQIWNYISASHRFLPRNSTLPHSPNKPDFPSTLLAPDRNIIPFVFINLVLNSQKSQGLTSLTFLSTYFI